MKDRDKTAKASPVFTKYRRYALGKIAHVGPRYLPFADVATKDVPLSRLLRLSLFQITVGMALVLLVGTLNRVMIVELSVPAVIGGHYAGPADCVCAVSRPDRFSL